MPLQRMLLWKAIPGAFGCTLSRRDPTGKGDNLSGISQPVAGSGAAAAAFHLDDMAL